MNKRTIATLPRDRYDVQDVLGSGPWGTVVRAKDRKLGTSLAVKTLQNLEPDGVTRLLRLLKLQAGLDHTNLIRLLDVWQAGSRPAGKQRQTLLLTELLTGQTVEDRVRHGGALPVEQAVTITCLALEGLEQLHSREVLHRNIKPSNIFLQGERESHGDHVKVLDFGLARLGLARLEFFEEDHGPGLDGSEVAHLAPEQLSHGDVDQRSDLFSLAMVLSFSLTGEHPFVTGQMDLAAAAEAVLVHVPRFLVTPPKLPLDLLRVLARALSKEPDQRYATAGELREALDPWFIDPKPEPEPLVSDGVEAAAAAGVPRARPAVGGPGAVGNAPWASPSPVGYSSDIEPAGADTRTTAPDPADPDGNTVQLPGEGVEQPEDGGRDTVPAPGKVSGAPAPEPGRDDKNTVRLPGEGVDSTADCDDDRITAMLTHAAPLEKQTTDPNLTILLEEGDIVEDPGITILLSSDEVDFIPDDQADPKGDTPAKG